MRNEGLRLGQETRLTNLNGDDTQISGPQIRWRFQFGNRVEIIYRKQCAWGKFPQHKLILLNKHVSLRLRSKLFHSTSFPTKKYFPWRLPSKTVQEPETSAVQKGAEEKKQNPTAMFGFASLPLTQRHLHKLDATDSGSVHPARQRVA